MTADEKAIIDYLKGYRDAFVGVREIARRAGGKQRYEEDNSWARSVLRGMVSKGWLEMNSTGQFRIPLEDNTKKKKAQRHLSPQMRSLLEKSGRKFNGIIDGDGA